MSAEHSARVVTFGELLLRLSPPGEERLLQSFQLLATFGGAEANVAVALSHLGVRCDYVTRLPLNPIGDAALDALKREGVGTNWILRGGARMGLYFVEPGPDLRTMRVVYDRAGSAFAELDPRTLAWPDVLSGVDWFHATGITPALGTGPTGALGAAIGCARTRGATVSFDLNYREALWSGRDPRAVIEPLVAQADVLIGNAAAARVMLHVEPGTEEGDLARQLSERYGSRLVVLTHRDSVGPREQGWSALLYDRGSGALAQSRRHRMQVVDRVGGGDAFAGALIATLLRHRPPADALEFAVAAGALKLTTAGDFCRFGEQEIEEFLRACT